MYIKYAVFQRTRGTQSKKLSAKSLKKLINTQYFFRFCLVIVTHCLSSLPQCFSPSMNVYKALNGFNFFIIVVNHFFSLLWIIEFNSCSLILLLFIYRLKLKKFEKLNGNKKSFKLMK